MHTDQTTLERASSPARPLLFEQREYVIEMDGGTTTCVSSTTSPVKEYTPDD